MTTIIEQARTSGLLFDGAMGTMFIQKGLTGGQVSEYWTLEHPDAVTEIHRQYIEAGADVLTTNTFGGNAFKLARSGLAERIEEINRTAVALARAAAGKKGYVAGDLGSTGEMLAPVGTLKPQAAQAAFKEQAGYLAQAGADLIIVETMFDLAEALAAIQGAREACDVPIFATMTFQETPQGFVTIMGNEAEDSLSQLLAAGALAVGANCSLGSDAMLTMARQLRAKFDAPLIFQPNAGMPETEDDQIFYPEKAEGYAENLIRLKALGIEIIGGCCGTTPDYIRAIRDRL
ncbi:MAG: homocysteine S-methyltransferase family protein [Desulfobacterales bacterium]